MDVNTQPFFPVDEDEELEDIPYDQTEELTEVIEGQLTEADPDPPAPTVTYSDEELDDAEA
jgi:hypothetical protein